MSVYIYIYIYIYGTYTHMMCVCMCAVWGMWYEFLEIMRRVDAKKKHVHMHRLDIYMH
jgi:hypothetical protein